MLFDIANRSHAEDHTIVFISLRLDEVRELCDRATVFRHGRPIHTGSVVDHSDDGVIRLMNGRSLQDMITRESALDDQVSKKTCAPAAPNLTLPGNFKNISISVNMGVIVDMAGLVGTCRTDVVGGVSINGGVGSVPGTVMGVVFLGADSVVLA